MKSWIILIIILSCASGNSFNGMNNWYHPHSLALVGSGGSLSNIASDILNPATIWSQPRTFEVGFVAYPANIYSQSIFLLLPNQNSTSLYSVRHMNYGIFNGKSEQNTLTSNYAASDTWINWSQAGHIKKWPLIWGINAGGFYSLIENKDALTLTYSAGIILNSDKQQLQTGLSLVSGGYVINQFTDVEEKLNMSVLFSFSKKLKYLPLVMAVDILKNPNFDPLVLRMGGVFQLPYHLKIKLGTSTNRLDQSIYENAAKNILSDTGMGIEWNNTQYQISYGIYIYGPGGTVSGLSFGTKF